MKSLHRAQLTRTAVGVILTSAAAALLGGCPSSHHGDVDASVREPDAHHVMRPDAAFIPDGAARADGSTSCLPAVDERFGFTPSLAPEVEAIVVSCEDGFAAFRTTDGATVEFRTPPLRADDLRPGDRVRLFSWDVGEGSAIQRDQDDRPFVLHYRTNSLVPPGEVQLFGLHVDPGAELCASEVGGCLIHSIGMRAYHADGPTIELEPGQTATFHRTLDTVAHVTAVDGGDCGDGQFEFALRFTYNFDDGLVGRLEQACEGARCEPIAGTAVGVTRDMGGEPTAPFVPVAVTHSDGAGSFGLEVPADAAYWLCVGELDGRGELTPWHLGCTRYRAVAGHSWARFQSSPDSVGEWVETPRG